MPWWMWWSNIYIGALFAYIFGIYFYYTIKDEITDEDETWVQYILIGGGVFIVSLFGLLRFS